MFETAHILRAQPLVLGQVHLQQRRQPRLIPPLGPPPGRLQHRQHPRRVVPGRGYLRILHGRLGVKQLRLPTLKHPQIFERLAVAHERLIRAVNPQLHVPGLHQIPATRKIIPQTAQMTGHLMGQLRLALHLPHQHLRYAPTKPRTGIRRQPRLQTRTQLLVHKTVAPHTLPLQPPLCHPRLQLLQHPGRPLLGQQLQQPVYRKLAPEKGGDPQKNPVVARHTIHRHSFCPPGHTLHGIYRFRPFTARWGRLIPSFCIRNSSVEGGTPRISAAPPWPRTLQLVMCRM